jgi:hypothetical protein
MPTAPCGTASTAKARSRFEFLRCAKLASAGSPEDLSQHRWQRCRAPHPPEKAALAPPVSVPAIRPRSTRLHPVEEVRRRIRLIEDKLTRSAPGSSRIEATGPRPASAASTTPAPAPSGARRLAEASPRAQVRCRQERRCACGRLGAGYAWGSARRAYRHSASLVDPSFSSSRASV